MCQKKGGTRKDCQCSCFRQSTIKKIVTHSEEEYKNLYKIPGEDYIPSGHVKNQTDRLNCEQSHISHMNSTSIPVAEQGLSVHS